MWQQMPTDGSCRSEATAVRITSNPVKRVVRRVSDLTALKSPLITLGSPDRLQNAGADVRRAIHNAPSHHASFSTDLSRVPLIECWRTACNFILNKGLTRLRTVGWFVPFRWHFIVSTLPSFPDQEFVLREIILQFLKHVEHIELFFIMNSSNKSNWRKRINCKLL